MTSNTCSTVAPQSWVAHIIGWGSEGVQGGVGVLRCYGKPAEVLRPLAQLLRLFEIARLSACARGGPRRRGCRSCVYGLIVAYGHARSQYTRALAGLPSKSGISPQIGNAITNSDPLPPKPITSPKLPLMVMGLMVKRVVLKRARGAKP
jgi:hypothetical protein